MTDEELETVAANARTLKRCWEELPAAETAGRPEIHTMLLKLVHEVRRLRSVNDELGRDNAERAEVVERERSRAINLAHGVWHEAKSADWANACVAIASAIDDPTSVEPACMHEEIKTLDCSGSSEPEGPADFQNPEYVRAFLAAETRKICERFEGYPASSEMERAIILQMRLLLSRAVEGGADPALTQVTFKTKVLAKNGRAAIRVDSVPKTAEAARAWRWLVGEQEH